MGRRVIMQIEANVLLQMPPLQDGDRELEPDELEDQAVCVLHSMYEGLFERALREHVPGCGPCTVHVLGHAVVRTDDEARARGRGFVEVVEEED